MSKMFNFEKQIHLSDAGCPQESDGAIRFSICGLEFTPNHVLLYDVTVMRNVI